MKRALSSLIENTDVREFIIINIEVEKITESNTQARTYFDENKLSELTESIKKSGVLQPIIVQLLGNENYQLIAGERRLRASKAAGLKTIPCLVKDVTDKVKVYGELSFAQVEDADNNWGTKLGTKFTF